MIKVDVAKIQRELRALDAMIHTMKRRTARGAQRIALTKATTPTLKRARALAPAPGGTRSGILRKSLGKKVKTNTRRDSVTVIIGPRRGVEIDFKAPGESGFRTRRPSRYAHLVEHQNKGQAFLNPAYEQTKGKVLATYKAEMGAAIEKSAKRVRSQMNRRRRGGR